MIKRQAAVLVKNRLSQFPAVALVGPRQVGKTTLAKTLSNFYFDLEQNEERLRLDLQWEEIVQQKRLVILDEAQTHPEIFPKLRGAIDQNRKRNGRFLILGSVAPGLMREVSESLAGRLALCELTPLMLSELPQEKNRKRLWLKGGYPDGGVIGADRFPLWQKNYLALLAQRDLPQWGLPAKPQIILRLFKMLAAGHGQIWNASQIAASLGLNYHTVNSYLDYLINAYLIRLLPPYHANIRKRLIKSPKLYWRDSGLLHALYEIRTFDGLLAQPWVGHSWEGWVIEQILSFLSTMDKAHEAYFLRTNDGYELDLILKFSQELWAFEIKLSSTPGPDDVKKLKTAADFIKADRRLIISKTARPIHTHDFISTNIENLQMILSKT